MKLVNATRYRTIDLRRFFLAGLKAEGVSPRGLWIICAHARGRAVGGVAWLTEIRMSLPVGLPSRMLEFAQVFVHEVGHTQGLGHKDMMDWWLIEAPWAEGLVIREKPKPVEVRCDLQSERKARAERKLAEHEAKLKREQKLIRKWRRKVRYYGRVFEKRAANPSPRERAHWGPSHRNQGKDGSA